MKYFKLDYQKNLSEVRSQPLQVIIFILVVFFLLAFVNLNAQDISKPIIREGSAELLTGTKTKGSYNVGFKLINFNDNVRTNKNKPRTLKMLIWYPSDKNDNNIIKMSIGDYLLNSRNIEMAIKSYENSLKLDPKNTNTVKKMTKLIKDDIAK